MKERTRKKLITQKHPKQKIIFKIMRLKIKIKKYIKVQQKKFNQELN